MTRLLFIFLLGSLATIQARTWVTKEGKQIEALLVDSHDTEVSIRLRSGRETTLALSELEQYDLNYIQTWKASLPAWQEQHIQANITPFSAPWPKRITTPIKQEITIVSEDSEQKRFIYQSQHYEYICDVRLSKSVISKFALLFESTHNYCRSLPLKLEKPLRARQKRLPIILCESMESYHQMGGPPGSAGVFMSSRNLVMVPLPSIGVKKVGSGYMIDHKKNNHTLPHELTHQLTDRAYYRTGARGWFSEGLAEYVAATPYRSGKHSLNSQTTAVKSYATEFGRKNDGGRGIGDKIDMPRLKTFMTMSYSQFLQNGNKNYALGLMLTHYFIHWDGEEDRASLNAFLESLRSNEPTDKALGKLLNGRSFEQLELEFAKAWRSRGIKISFTS